MNIITILLAAENKAVDTGLIGFFIPGNPKFSWVMLALLLLSFLAVALIIERFLYIGRRLGSVDQFLEKVRNAFNTGGTPEVIAIAEKSNLPVANVVKVAFENIDENIDIIAELMESEIMNERTKLERFFGGINTIGTVAPLLGLLGTVIGLIKSFMDIAISGQAGPLVVAAGIGEALYTTEFGLIIAVPVIYFYNYFSKKTADMTDEMEVALRKLLKFITAEVKSA